jgi:hypothetical protein
LIDLSGNPAVGGSGEEFLMNSAEAAVAEDGDAAHHP